MFLPIFSIPFHQLHSCSPFPIKPHPFLSRSHIPLHTSSGAASTSFSCSWTCHPATLFSCLPTFYPCSFPASIVPTQTPPPPHLSLVASGHFSCTPSSRYLGSTGGEQASMPVVGVPGAGAACRDWKQPGKESPAQPRELRGGACSLIPWGWWITRTLMRPKRLTGKAAASVQPKNLDRNIALKCWMHPCRAWANRHFLRG